MIGAAYNEAVKVITAAPGSASLMGGSRVFLYALASEVQTNGSEQESGAHKNVYQIESMQFRSKLHVQ